MPSGVYVHKRRGIESRFWEKVDRREPDECWNWTAGVTTKGYGSLKIEGSRALPAHIVSWEIHFGVRPHYRVDRRERCVCHKCDNRLCVNPQHLFLGTHAENMADMGSKLRGSKTKLVNRTQVRDIRILASLGIRQETIAAKYGVCRPNISMIVSRKTFASLPDPKIQISCR